jgi:hypothetical protein
MHEIDFERRTRFIRSRCVLFWILTIKEYPLKNGTEGRNNKNKMDTETIQYIHPMQKGKLASQVVF